MSPTASPPASHSKPSRGSHQIAPVILLGTGLGDPDLLTVRATRALAEVDVVIAGDEVPAGLLRDLAAEVVTVTVDQDASKEMVSRARAGLRVVRVHSGDPF